MSWKIRTLNTSTIELIIFVLKNGKVQLLSSWDGFDEVWSENQLGIVHLFEGNF